MARDPWDEYPADSLKGVIRLIKQAECPILGICGGHQLIALAYGGRVDRIKRLKPGHGYDGCWRESGYVGVGVRTDDPLLGDKNSKLNVFESHYDEVKSVPREFTVTASNNTCAVQAMRHRKRAVYGVQFHPERWDNGSMDGRQVLQRFLGLCTREKD